MSCANSCKCYFCVTGSWSPTQTHKVGFPPHETHFVTLIGQQWTGNKFLKRQLQARIWDGFYKVSGKRKPKILGGDLWRKIQLSLSFLKLQEKKLKYCDSWSDLVCFQVSKSIHFGHFKKSVFWFSFLPALSFEPRHPQPWQNSQGTQPRAEYHIAKTISILSLSQDTRTFFPIKYQFQFRSKKTFPALIVMKKN